MNRIKLLLIDDEERWSCGLKEWLEDTKEFDVLIETCGSNVAQSALTFKADILLMDWNLRPQGEYNTEADGIALATKIRITEQGLTQVPIVIVTLWDLESLRKNIDGSHEDFGIYVALKKWNNNRILATITNALYRWATKAHTE